MIQRKNEKGDAYQRIFVHIQDWTETADAQKARERLLAGKELKIVYDDPWFWKASLNTWAPKPKPETTMYDRKPRIRLEFEDKEEEDKEEELPYDIRWGDELARRKRQEVRKNVESATALMSSLSLEEDRRPYAERRVDPVYCEQDIKSGFRDRRESRNRRDDRDRRPRSPSRSPPRNNRRDDQRDDRRRVSRFSNKDRSRSPDRRDYRDGYSAVIYQQTEKPVITNPKPIVIAQALPEPVIKVKEVVVAKAVEKPAYKMDPEIVRLMCIFHKIDKSDVTEELYKNNAQQIRDMKQDEIQTEEETKEHKASKIDYNGCAPAPRRKQRQIIAEEVKKDA
jgi:hypothetical protein